MSYIPSVVHEVEIVLENLIEFFSSHGVTNGYFLLKLLHLHQETRNLLATQTGQVKRAKIDARFRMIEILGQVQHVFEELSNLYQRIDFSRYSDSQKHLSKLLCKQCPLSILGRINLAGEKHSFEASFFEQNILLLKTLIKASSKESEEETLCALDQLATFNTVNSAAYKEFQHSDQKMCYDEFLAQRREALSSLYHRTLFSD